jgi:multicomponent Na+:H+ antiporter subunit B
MSRRKTDEEYSKTKAYKFFKWLNGENDLSPEETKMDMGLLIPSEDDSTIKERMKERQMAIDKAYDESNNRLLKIFNKSYRVIASLFLVVLAALLIYNTAFLPPVGERNKPDNNEVTERYIEKGLEETGAVNIVTGMILDYRAFDTFGESNVLFVATITVLILLRINKGKDNRLVTEDHAGDDTSDRDHEPKNDVILQYVASFLVPIIMIFGIYVILNGHLSPGGGFSGGAIMGAGLILYLNAFGFEKTEKFFTEKTYKWISFFALTTYCLCKAYSFYCGANHLDSHIPLGTPGAILSSGLILILNICVGMVVTCTMYTFYVMFRKGDF